MNMDRASLIPALTNIATRLRIDSVRATSEAGSGHPTSCMSMADLTAALFFAEMRFDPKDPKNPESDRFVLSKGHAARPEWWWRRRSPFTVAHSLAQRSNADGLAPGRNEQFPPSVDLGTSRDHSLSQPMSPAFEKAVQ